MHHFVDILYVEVFIYWESDEIILLGTTTMPAPTPPTLKPVKTTSMETTSVQWYLKILLAD